MRKRTRRRAVEAVEIARKWVRQCEMQGDSHRSHSATTADSLSGSAKDPMTATVTELLESQQTALRCQKSSKRPLRREHRTGDDGVGTGGGPVHVSWLEAGSDGDLAAGLDDLGRSSEASGAQGRVVQIGGGSD